jgi:hypothetical protein
VPLEGKADDAFAEDEERHGEVERSQSELGLIDAVVATNRPALDGIVDVAADLCAGSIPLAPSASRSRRTTSPISTPTMGTAAREVNGRVRSEQRNVLAKAATPIASRPYPPAYNAMSAPAAVINFAHTS